MVAKNISTSRNGAHVDLQLNCYIAIYIDFWIYYYISWFPNVIIINKEKFWEEKFLTKILSVIYSGGPL